MILTTDLLIERYGSCSVQIIEQIFPFRYVHLNSNGKLKVVAFSDYSIAANVMLKDAKIAVEQAEPIGEYLRSKFSSVVKTCLEEGIVKVDAQLQEQLKSGNVALKYKLFDLKIIVASCQHSLCDVVEVYHPEFYPTGPCPSNSISLLEKSNLYSYLRKHQIELYVP